VEAPLQLRLFLAPQIAKKPYQFLLISALREYLTLEFEPPQPLAFPYDPERIIDDFGAQL
jgi:5'-3' exoribonuclease 2